MCTMTVSLIISFNILPTILIKLTGQLFRGRVLLPFLWIADIFACFQSIGNLPVVRDVLNMIESRMLVQFSNSFMTLGWRPSDLGDWTKKGYSFVTYT